MQKLIPSLLLAACALALAGCSSTPTKVNSGPIQARTFSFVNGRPGAEPAYADSRQSVHAAIQDAITRNLTARGLSRQPANGDITVGYLVITGDNATTTAVSDYFGYGGDAAALQDKAHTAHTGSKNPNYFEAGTLVIDIYNTQTHKLLLRNYTTRQLFRNLPAGQRSERLQGAVDEILRDLRVQP